MTIKRIRFFITDEEDRRRSSTWSFFTHNNDAYLFVRSLGGKMKLSLHHPGISEDGKDSQLGLVGHHAKKLIEAGHTLPDLVRWTRPSCHAVQGNAVIVARLLFPSDHLNRTFSKYVDDDKLKVSPPMAPDGMATEIAIHYHLEAPSDFEKRIEASGAIPIAHEQLLCGEYISLIFNSVEFKRLSYKIRPQRLLSSDLSQINHNDLSAIVYDVPSDGDALQLIELNGLASVTHARR